MNNNNNPGYNYQNLPRDDMEDERRASRRREMGVNNNDQGMFSLEDMEKNSQAEERMGFIRKVYGILAA